jgi:hypothetical protein
MSDVVACVIHLSIVLDANYVETNDSIETGFNLTVTIIIITLSTSSSSMIHHYHLCMTCAVFLKGILDLVIIIPDTSHFFVLVYRVFEVLF